MKTALLFVATGALCAYLFWFAGQSSPSPFHYGVTAMASVLLFAGILLGRFD